MKWLNSNLDGLPADKQEVFISVDGVYHLAVYNQSAGMFHVKDDATQSFLLKNHVIYWMEISPDNPLNLPLRK